MADGPTPDQADPGEILAGLRRVEKRLETMERLLRGLTQEGLQALMEEHRRATARIRELEQQLGLGREDG